MFWVSLPPVKVEDEVCESEAREEPGRHMQNCTPWGKQKKEKEKIRRKDVLAPTEKPRGLTGLLLEPRVALNSSPTQLDCHILF